MHPASSLSFSLCVVRSDAVRQEPTPHQNDEKTGGAGSDGCPHHRGNRVKHVKGNVGSKDPRRMSCLEIYELDLLYLKSAFP